MPVEIRENVTVESWFRETGLGASPELGSQERGPVAAGNSASSARVFHPPQEGQRPIHFIWAAPHSLQTYLTVAFGKVHLPGFGNKSAFTFSTAVSTDGSSGP
jgi:hypothetical protein